MVKETNRRSFAKGVSWRILGTLDTIVIAFFITGELTLAVSIGAIEVMTKIFLYYLHERVWVFLKKHFSLSDAHWVSFTKGVSWRAIGTIDTMMISFLVTGTPTMALSIGLIEVFTKIILYYLHDRAWTVITWGRTAI